LPSNQCCNYDGRPPCVHACILLTLSAARAGLPLRHRQLPSRSWTPVTAAATAQWTSSSSAAATQSQRRPAAAMVLTLACSLSQPACSSRLVCRKRSFLQHCRTPRCLTSWRERWTW
jgi:hypothetical protein